MKQGIFLDDVRWPHQVTYTVFPQAVLWHIVRSYDAFVNEVTRWYEEHGELPDVIAFDHDLAPEHYVDAGIILPVTDYPAERNMDGYDAAKWLVRFCEEHDLSLPDCYCHSMNPAGKRNILACLEEYARRHP